MNKTVYDHVRQFLNKANSNVVRFWAKVDGLSNNSALQELNGENQQPVIILGLLSQDEQDRVNALVNAHNGLVTA